MKLFFQRNPKVSLELLFINDRDEATRYEPLHLKENKKACQAINTTSWAKYPDTVILIAGEGHENQIPTSPNN